LNLVATLQRLMRRDAALTERASCYLGVLALEARDFAAAEKIFKRVVKEWPRNELALEGERLARAGGGRRARAEGGGLRHGAPFVLIAIPGRAPQLWQEIRRFPGFFAGTPI